MESWRFLYLVVLLVFLGKGGGQLAENFYGFSCLNVEFIVRQTVISKLNLRPTVPATLRLFLHDCFVEGCDASIMIASPNNDAEKDAPDNLSLAGDGFDTIIKAKQAIEMQCPGVVSCADILAIAARDVITLSGGPTYNVELGRRDGLVSQMSRVAGNLPEPESDLTAVNTLFNKHNLTQTDMIALSGAHTVGSAHCNRFEKRLYSSPADSSLDPDYAQQLMSSCPQDVNPDVVLDLDYLSPSLFDNQYYKNLIDHKGLLTSDQVLYTDPVSQDTVKDFASNTLKFNDAFATGMIKLGRVGVKTGNQGEIRRDCSAFNS